ncbi:MAG: hypothetical protein ACLU38_02380 [Dysosmobacter sp.]
MCCCSSLPCGPDSVRRLMDAVSKTCGGLAAVFAGEEGHYAYALGRGGRTGHQPSGQGRHEYGASRAGRRTERLRSRQRGGGAERHRIVFQGEWIWNM